MSDKNDPQKMQQEFMDQMKRFFQATPPVTPETDKARQDDEEKTAKKRSEKLKFNLKPKEVKKYLDRFVIQQEDAKRVLATAVCDHYRYVQRPDEEKSKHYVKQNIVMLGPTGVGKTFLIKSLSELIGVPFVKADATKFSETGYVGGDVDDVIRELVHKADGDVSLAECGMVYIDEVDKIAADANLQGRDVSGRGVQQGLLKIMEDTEIPLRNPQDVQSQIQAMVEYQQKGKLSRPTIRTGNILFIVSGAFSDLKDTIERRLRSSELGFATKTRKKLARDKILKQDDLIEFGFEPEFVGRLPVRVVCDSLTAQDLYTILKTSEASILKQYTASFGAYNINVEFEDDALWEIAKLASEEKTGGRALVTICERILRDLKYELPSSKVAHFKLTKEMVLSPQAGLRELLKEERKERAQEITGSIQAYEKAYFEKHGLPIQFSKEAATMIQEKVFEGDVEVEAYLDKALSNYAYGLGLVQKKKPRDKFILDERVLREPNHILEEWIKETFEEGEK